MTGFFAADAAAQGKGEPDRTVPPIQEPKYPHSTVFDARNATPPPRFQVKAPAKAPNVLIVLIDDMGFGQSSAFGGPIHMPTVERLAAGGLRYNEFHTTALCSPTRAALLSGRNSHMNNFGSIAETATAFPGQTGQRPNSVGPLAEMLRLNGYSTAAFGKSHETAAWEVSPSGPTDRWPTRSGFDKFYGFIGGETNQWAPLIYDGMNQIETPKDPNYHFMADMTNQAIAWMGYQKSLTPDKPFFIYFAPGATHARHHVPKERIAKYKGKFDQGWDKLREETLARQIKLGVVPAGTKLATKPEAIKDWVALLAGGLAFDTPPFAVKAEPSAINAVFTLYNDQATAMRQPDINSARYVLYFPESLRGLTVGAPVMLLGLTAGEVVDVGLDIDPALSKIRGRVEILFYPHRLAARLSSKEAAIGQLLEHSVQQRHALLQRLVQQRGLRAQLRSGSIVTGQLYVALDYFPDAPKAKIDWSRDPVEFPVMPSEITDLEQKVSGILAKLDKLPYEAIGADVTKALVSLDQTLKSVDKAVNRIDAELTPGLKTAVEELRRTIASADGVLKSTDATLVGKDAPGQQELRDALQEITRAARSLRILTDFLERHPEALLRGKTEEKP